LLTADLDTEIFPASPIIPPSSGLMNVKLMVKPKAVGMLKVLGYTTVVCGVKSNCRLRDLTSLKPAPITDIVLEVLPPLPRIALSCSLPKSTVFTTGSLADDVVTTGSAVLFAGQSTECIVTVQNVSEYPLEKLTVKLNSKNDVQSALQRILNWGDENIQSQLPLLPNHQLCFSLCINGDSDFLVPAEQPLRSPMSQSSRTRAESMDAKDKTIDAVLSLKYSGGEGLKAGYCRTCSLALNLDILPSVYLTSWDLQHTDSSSECRLCLDLINVSSHQIDIQYGDDKSIIIEPQQTRRISLNVPRLDPDQVDTSSVQNDRVPLHYRTKLLPDPYSQILANYVDIRWTMPAAKASGKVGVDYIKWTTEQLLVLLTPDVRWGVHLNKKPFLTSSRFRFSVGEMVEVTVTLENTTGEEKENCSLCIEPCQRPAAEDIGLDGANVSVIGSSALYVPKVASSTEVKHSCSFMFFVPGWYSLAITFKHNKPAGWGDTPARAAAGGGGGDGGERRTGGCDGVKSKFTRKREDWTCTVPVKFEVT
ncbi:unnamed protein product, partial [Lymnaea stagnalis]